VSVADLHGGEQEVSFLGQTAEVGEVLDPQKASRGQARYLFFTGRARGFGSDPREAI